MSLGYERVRDTLQVNGNDIDLKWFIIKVWFSIFSKPNMSCLNCLLCYKNEQYKNMKYHVSVIVTIQGKSRQLLFMEFFTQTIHFTQIVSFKDFVLVFVFNGQFYSSILLKSIKFFKS